MKRCLRLLGLFLLVLAGTYSFSQPNSIGNKSGVIIISGTGNSGNELPNGGGSPFIRFHSATNVSGVSISTPGVSKILLKPVNEIPEKFVGILSYLSSLSFRLPVTREIYYSTPLRSPPYSVKG